jgi:hypothetical protein
MATTLVAVAAEKSKHFATRAPTRSCAMKRTATRRRPIVKSAALRWTYAKSTRTTNAVKIASMRKATAMDARRRSQTMMKIDHSLMAKSPSTE